MITRREHYELMKELHSLSEDGDREVKIIEQAMMAWLEKRHDKEPMYVVMALLTIAADSFTSICMSQDRPVSSVLEGVALCCNRLTSRVSMAYEAIENGIVDDPFEAVRKTLRAGN